ncbi:MAG: DUF4861 family protein [Reichenbachiella sp.]|uniref:DUF4861 family protein n=1 Tax=Reichenbachiella sp. TaxID=2184521 RepID=UPI0032996D46
MKIKEKLIALVIATIIVSCQEDSVEISISNELDFDRSEEVVEVDMSVIDHWEVQDYTNLTVVDSSGQSQLFQFVDKDDDGIDETLLFIPQVKANNKSVYKLRKRRDSEEFKTSNVQCFSRFVPERTDDYAWENDKVAFRVFGPTAQKMAEDGIKGGTLSSGVDCWLKRVETPIIDLWYGRYLNDSQAYHHDHGEGLDDFHVGVSRGCGGIARKVNDTYLLPKNFTQHEMLTNGPLRTTFRLGYAQWGNDSMKIKHSQRVVLDKGSHFSKFDLTIEGTETIAVGLTLHEKDGEVDIDSLGRWVSYWQPHGDEDEMLGMAILTDPKENIGAEVYDVDEKDRSNVFVTIKVSNKHLRYYSGYGWTKAGQFKNKRDWIRYLAQFSNQLAHPLGVEYLLEDI